MPPWRIGRTIRPMTSLAPTPTLLGASVSDAMTSGLISCPPDVSLRKVAQIMTRERVHAIYVFDYEAEDGETPELWGLVSDLDLAAAGRGDIDRLTARGVSIAPLVTVSSDASLDHSAQLLSA